MSEPTSRITPSGTKYWQVNGIIHREDGPAVILHNGTQKWWFDDQEYPFDKWCEVANISDEQKCELKLKYG